MTLREPLCGLPYCVYINILKKYANRFSALNTYYMKSISREENFMTEIFAGEALLDEKLLLATWKWCMSRVSSSIDADDLTQDILLHALTAIRKGRVPDHFYPWYWALAHNRYCAFLKKKQFGAESLEDMNEGGMVAVGAVHEENYFTEDEVSKLNYVISRLSTTQRELVIRFYLKNQTVAQIAKALSLPEGTVKRRLFDVRADIKKGVENMAERTGMSAYAPAILDLNGGKMIPTYWNQIEEIMSTQIFVACMSEAKTMAEIADEIGVAPVYFEDKMKYLLENKFIKETAKGKYLTDFLIFPKQLEVDFYHERGKLLKEFGKELTEILYTSEKDIRAFDFYGNDMPYDYLLYLLYCWACDAMTQKMTRDYQKKWEGKYAKTEDKDWMLAGYVSFPDEQLERKPSNTVMWSNLHHHFAVGGYRSVTYANLYEAPPFLRERDNYISEGNIRTVMKIFEDPQAVLDEHEQMQAATLMEKGYIEKREDGLYLTLPVVSTKTTRKIYSYFEEKCATLSEKYMNAISALADRMIMPHVREDLLSEYVERFMLSSFWMLSSVLYYAIHEGKTLALPEDYERSAASTVIYYNK